MTYSIGGYKVQNVPQYAIDDVETKDYVIVARYVDDELWFWGCYPERRAEQVVNYVGGIICRKI